jgi:uncharacterized surface protein with fasciclin (FAS1) repeats
MKKLVVATIVGLLLGTMSAVRPLAGSTREAMAANKNIVEVATEAGSFKTLLTALKAAGLEDTLSGAGPFTVFAPTDEAFAKLPSGTLDALLKDIPKLKSILLYHVVAGKVSSSQVVKLSEAKSVEGSEIQITSGPSGVMVDGAKVIKADVEASNGLIHVVDSVILPPR